MGPPPPAAFDSFNVITAAALVGDAMSFFSIGLFLYAQNRQSKSLKKADISMWIVFQLSLANLLYCLCNVLGFVAIGVLGRDEYSSSPLCAFQGAFNNYLVPASVLWIGCINFALYVTLKHPEVKVAAVITSLKDVFLRFCWVAPVILAVVPLSSDAYGLLDQPWCWVIDSDSNIYWRLSLYLPVWLVVAFQFYLLFESGISMRGAVPILADIDDPTTRPHEESLLWIPNLPDISRLTVTDSSAESSRTKTASSFSHSRSSNVPPPQQARERTQTDAELYTIGGAEIPGLNGPSAKSKDSLAVPSTGHRGSSGSNGSSGTTDLEPATLSVPSTRSPSTASSVEPARGLPAPSVSEHVASSLVRATPGTAMTVVETKTDHDEPTNGRPGMDKDVVQYRRLTRYGMVVIVVWSLQSVVRVLQFFKVTVPVWLLTISAFLLNVNGFLCICVYGSSSRYFLNVRNQVSRFVEVLLPNERALNMGALELGGARDSSEDFDPTRRPSQSSAPVNVVHMYVIIVIFGGVLLPFLSVSMILTSWDTPMEERMDVWRLVFFNIFSFGYLLASVNFYIYFVLISAQSNDVNVQAGIEAIVPFMSFMVCFVLLAVLWYRKLARDVASGVMGQSPIAVLRGREDRKNLVSVLNEVRSKLKKPQGQKILKIWRISIAGGLLTALAPIPFRLAESRLFASYGIIHHWFVFGYVIGMLGCWTFVFSLLGYSLHVYRRRSDKVMAFDEIFLPPRQHHSYADAIARLSGDYDLAPQRPRGNSIEARREFEKELLQRHGFKYGLPVWWAAREHLQNQIAGETNEVNAIESLVGCTLLVDIGLVALLTVRAFINTPELAGGLLETLVVFLIVCMTAYISSVTHAGASIHTSMRVHADKLRKLKTNSALGEAPELAKHVESVLELLKHEDPPKILGVPLSFQSVQAGVVLLLGAMLTAIVRRMVGDD